MMLFTILPLISLLGASAAQSVPEKLKLTEAELAAYDGTDAEKPILLGINGTLFDVSAAPSFYGPGGHYHHFVGKDAARAWITECWDSPDQFTWRLDGVEAMFMPKWMDELLETAANGQLDSKILGDIKMVTPEMLANMAKKAMQRFGTVTDTELAERRIADKIEADAKVRETLNHWVNFFASNPKYKIVGEVIHETRPDPPEPCEEAMKKRPMKGGKLDSMMGVIGKAMGGNDKKDDAAAKKPDFVKDTLNDAGKEKAAKANDEKSHDEL